MLGRRNEKILRMSKANEHTSQTTDLTNIWSRPLDFNDHNVVFNYQRRNEYDNSFRFVQSYDLTALKCSIKNVQLETDSCPVNLYCNEQLLTSDDENDVTAENLGNFCDSDDSVKDKDYIPDSSESCSDEENMSKGYKLNNNHLLPTVSESNQPTIKEKKNDRPSQKVKISDEQQENVKTMKDITQKNKSTENRKKALKPQEIEKKQQLIQEDDQNNNVPTVPEPEGPTTEEKENDRPSQKDQISDQQSQENVETVEDINTRHKSIGNRKNALPPQEIEEKQQLIQEDNQNKDVSIVPEHDGPIMEDKENDWPSQEDQIRDQQLQESIVEEKDTPKRSETDNEISDPMNRQEIQVSLTKSGKPRQRRCFIETKEDRILKKDEKKKEKLAIKSACQESCLKKCMSKITEDQRREIHDSYVNMNYEEQGIFIKCMITEKPVQRRLATSAAKRKNTLVYNLKVDNTLTEVCKTYFLTTIGYNANNDCRIRSAMKKPIHEQQTKRGTYERTNKIDRQIIVDHIKTFNPCISHYRREHAPNRLYLPSDITITKMHEQFSLQFPNLKVSLELYRVVVKELNISFARLGHEECEQCTIFANHNSNHNEENIMDEACDDCLNYVVHKLKYTEARDEYQSDANKVNNLSDDVFYSVDLQKVIMLPRIDQYKTAVFCTRIIAFNESFVPIGKQKEPHVPFAAVWNETISGRNQEDIISTLQAFLIHKRDAKNVTLWLDNCAAQNKNWTLLSSLVQIVNSDLIAAETITLKYFETGHTFMSADSFHHQVEMALKRIKKVYDFHDFVDCVRSANSTHNYVKVMDFSDFFDYRDYTSQHKLRKHEPRMYLRDMVAIKVERGHYTLKFKESHMYGEFQTLDFLQTKIMKTQVFPETCAKTEPRGISEERKKAINTKLVPLMPENRRKYWHDLPVSDAKDLALID